MATLVPVGQIVILSTNRSKIVFETLLLVVENTISLVTNRSRLGCDNTIPYIALVAKLTLVLTLL